MHRPYLKTCMRPAPVVLQPGEALYGQIVLSSGLGGWQIAEPGTYRVYAALRTAAAGATTSAAGSTAGQVMAAPLMLRVERPASREQERLADDVYTDTVGRVLALGGSRVLNGANDVLRELVERIPRRGRRQARRRLPGTGRDRPWQGHAGRWRRGGSAPGAHDRRHRAGRQRAERRTGTWTPRPRPSATSV